MHSLARRAVVACLALAMTMGVAGTAAAAPTFRRRPLETRPNPDVVMRGSGWGHGVGMSQYGAYAQARAGWGYRRILKHYYTGIAVEQRQMPSRIRIGLELPGSFSNVDAITGSIPWRANVGGQWQTRWQPQGTTWEVRRGSAGGFVLRQGGTVMWKVDSERLLAAFNYGNRSDGTLVEAYNPNNHRRPDGTSGNRSEYKWGRLEYTPKSGSTTAMHMVLQIASMERYLRGLAEMPASWGTESNGGMAALKAQAVGGRSYAKDYHARGIKASCKCHIRATPYDQHFIGYDHERVAAPWVNAVDATAGVVATSGGAEIQALYSSSHGGRSENVEDVFYSVLPYLRSVDDPWSLKTPNPNASWEASGSNGSFAGFTGGGMAQVRRVRIVGRTDGGTPRSLRVWGLTSEGKPLTVDRTNAKGIIGLDLKRALALRSAQVRKMGFAPFTDDDSSPHEYASLYAYDAGIMTDVRVPRFRPGRDVARGRAALYLYRTFDLPAPTKNYYDDISDRPWAERKAINALAEAGISGGLRKRVFRPANVLTRAQAAVFFRNAIGMSKKNTAYDYFDDDDSTRAEAAINRMAGKGLMTGCGARKFCPGRGMKRGAMATLLHRTVEAYR